MRIILREAGSEYRIASDIPVRTPEDATRAAAEIAESETELFAVLSLNTKNGLKGVDIVTCGILDSSLVHPREVFRTAIIRGAAQIVLAHNHPTGDATPSAEDISITREIVAGGGVLDIPVLDSIILPAGGGVAFSMRENGLMDFTG